MKIFRGFEALPEFRHPAVTVGSFDGVHRGHRALIEELKAEACRNHGESIVLSFDPHPRIALGQGQGQGQSFPQLTTLDEKAHLLQDAGVDVLIIMPFDKQFAATSGEDFIRHYLIEKLHAKTIIAGYNHRFGHDRRDVANIQIEGLKVVRIEACEWKGTKVSSTVIRQLLEAGRREEAEELAGHPLTGDYDTIKQKAI